VSAQLGERNTPRDQGQKPSVSRSHCFFPNLGVGKMSTASQPGLTEKGVAKELEGAGEVIGGPYLGDQL